MTESTQLPWTERLSVDDAHYRVFENSMIQAAAKDMSPDINLENAQYIFENNTLPESSPISEMYSEMGMSTEDVACLAKFTAEESMKIAINQLKYAHMAIIALTIDCKLNHDASSWDMSQMALLGYYLSCDFKDDEGNLYKFDICSVIWRRECDSKEFNMHPESGEPILKYGEYNVISGNFLTHSD